MASPSMEADEKLRECASVAKGFFERGIAAQKAGNRELAVRCYEAGLESVHIGLLAGGSDEAQVAALCHYRDSVVGQVAAIKQDIAANPTEAPSPSNTAQKQQTNADPANPEKKGAWYSRMFSSNKKSGGATQNQQQNQQPQQQQQPQPQPQLRQKPVEALQKPQGYSNTQLKAKTPAGRTVHGGAVRGSSSTSASSAAAGTPTARSSSNIAAELQKRFDRKLVDEILKDVVAPGAVTTSWDSITGLGGSKQHLMEAVILPMQRPDLFNSSLRSPPKGVLLFGPPGNGKTLLAKAVANESKATFFSISASSLVSKYVGEGEKMVRTLFGCAQALSPSVVFIDEADSLLSARGEEHDAMRRLKTEVLVQMDGVASEATSGERVLVLAATNRPADIDSACLRRFTKRLHIPLPDKEGRAQHIKNLLSTKDVTIKLSQSDVGDIVARTEMYSFSDMTALVKEAAMYPLRDLGGQAMTAKAEDIRPVGYKDFRRACDVCFCFVLTSLNTLFLQEPPSLCDCVQGDHREAWGHIFLKPG